MDQKQFKVIQLLPLQQGVSERGEWKSQEVILEECQNVRFPDRFLVRFPGEMTPLLAGLKVGDVVVASWSAYVREFTTKDGRKIYSQVNSGWQITKP